MISSNAVPAEVLAELEHEEAMVLTGAKRWEEHIEKLGATSTMAGGAHVFLRLQTKLLIEALEKTEWKKMREDVRAIIQEVGVERCALITVRLLLDRIFQGEPLPWPIAIGAIGRAVEEEMRIRRLMRQEKKVWGEFEMYYHRASPQRRRTFIRRVLADKEILGIERKTRNSVGYFLLSSAVEHTKFFTIENTKQKDVVRAVVSIHKQAFEWIEKQNFRISQLFPTLEPMLIPPRPWVEVEDGGYYSEHVVARRPLIHDARPEDFPIENDAPWLEAVNDMQAVPWRYDSWTVGLLQHMLEKRIAYAGLPQQDVTIPTLPPKEIFRARYSPEDQAQMRRNHAQAQEHNRKQRLLRMRMVRTSLQMEKFQKRGAVYFPCVMDFRGRVYQVGSRLAYQGGDIARGALRFVSVRPVPRGEAGNLFAVHGATRFIGSRVTIEERIEWARKNAPRAIECARDPLGDLPFWGNAEEPWQALAWCRALLDVQRTGATNVPVIADATCNLVQILAGLMGDEDLLAATNVLPGPAPRDLYSEIAAEAYELALRDPQPNAQAHLRKHFPEGFPRDLAKRLIVPVIYGSRMYSHKARTRLWLDDERPLLPAWDLTEETSLLDDLVPESMWVACERRLASVLSLVRWLYQLGLQCGRAQMVLRWRTLDDFEAHNRYYSETQSSVRVMSGGRTDHVRLLPRDEQQLSGANSARAMPANFIHSLDATILRITVSTMESLGFRDHVFVHDCYGGHAADQPARNIAFREAYRQVIEADPLRGLWARATELLGRPVEPPPQPRKVDLSSVLSSAYFAS